MEPAPVRVRDGAAGVDSAVRPGVGWKVTAINHWRDARLAAVAVAARPIVAIAALFVASRLALLAVGLLTVHQLEPGLAGQGASSISALLCRWDCNWYVEIAQNWYTSGERVGQPGATGFAFLPLFPLLTRSFAGLTGLPTVDAAVLVANACFLAALIYVYAYARLDFERRTALLGVALLAFAPHGFIFSAGYAESLLLLLLAAAMYHLRRDQYLAAGVAAGLLSATHGSGILFVVFAAAWLVVRHGRRLAIEAWRRPEQLVPVFLAPLGLFAFWFYSFAVTGDGFAQATTQGYGWGWRAGLPWHNLATFLGGDTNSFFWALSSLVAFALSLLLLRYRLYAEFAFCAAMLVLYWTGQVPLALLRHVIVLFPIWIVLARFVAPRPVLAGAVFAALATIGGFLMVAWTMVNTIAI